MNNELRAIAIKSGAPEEVLEEMWFNLFCMKFAHYIIEELETEQLDK